MREEGKEAVPKRLFAGHMQTLSVLREEAGFVAGA
jgi:hypothetical protein